MTTTTLAQDLAQYAIDTAHDTGADLATARRMMSDEPQRVCAEVGCSREDLDAWLAGDHADVDAPSDWQERYGSIERARREGVCGDLAQVSDGTMTYVCASRWSDAAEMLADFLATASYTGEVTVRGLIVGADGTEIDSGRASHDYGTSEEDGAPTAY